MKKEDRLKILIVFCLVILLISSVFMWKSLFFYLSFSKSLEKKIYDVSFEVGDNIGIDLNNSILSFGRIMPGTSLTRDFFIVNNYSFPIIVKVYASKNIAGFLSYDDEIIITQMSERKVPITLTIPEGFAYGNYTGKVVIYLYKYNN